MNKSTLSAVISRETGENCVPDWFMDVP